MLVICFASWCGEEGSSVSGRLFYQIDSLLTNSSNQHFFPSCNLEQSRYLDYFPVPSLVSFALWV